jgi:MFS transporter, DHA1 family, inner membrane transport protein
VLPTDSDASPGPADRRPSPRPDPRSSGSRLSLLALALGGFGIGTAEFVTMGLLPQMAHNLKVSIPAGGHLVSAYALGAVAGAPILAVVSARFPRTRLLLVLMAIFTLGNLASALAPSYAALLAARFVSGLPHGIYFGVGSVVATALVAPHRRGRAVAANLAGLTVANVIGVPLATSLGQHFGWRSAYWFVAATGALTIIAIWRFVPAIPAAESASARRELTALARPQIWLACLTGAIGFGGFFGVYSYIAPILTDVTGWPPSAVPYALVVFGLGMTVGNLVGGRVIDRSVMGALYGSFTAMLAVLLVFPFAARATWSAGAAVFLLGATGMATVPALQARLMDVARDAQSLAASMNHSALNMGNAIGPFLSGIAIDQGLGWTSTAWVGSALAAGGLVFVVVGSVLSRPS